MDLPSEIRKIMMFDDYYYVYVLQSEKDGKRYIGYTNNLARRFEEHSEGQVESTKQRRPFTLVYFEGCLSQDDAIKREKYFKTHHGRMFLAKRLKSYFNS